MKRRKLPSTPPTPTVAELQHDMEQAMAAERAAEDKVAFEEARLEALRHGFAALADRVLVQLQAKDERLNAGLEALRRHGRDLDAEIEEAAAGSAGYVILDDMIPTTIDALLAGDDDGHNPTEG